MQSLFSNLKFNIFYSNCEGRLIFHLVSSFLTTQRFKPVSSLVPPFQSFKARTHNDISRCRSILISMLIPNVRINLNSDSSFHKNNDFVAQNSAYLTHENFGDDYFE